MTTREPLAHPLPDDDTVLGAALAAFAARGFEGTSVRELTRELGVSHNFVHQRFGSKERLWYAAVDHGFARLAGDLAQLDVTAEADDLARLRASVVRFVESMSSRPDLLRIITVESTSPGPRLDYLFETYIAPVGELGASVLSNLRAAGKVRTESVALVYFMMTLGAAGPMALPALGRLFGETVDPDDGEAIRRHAVEAVNVLFDGLAT